MENTFLKYGYSQEEIDRKVQTAWEAVFEGNERFYMDVGDGTAFVTDTGNNDVRTEGMSYAMMFAVQFDRKDIFDKLWKWALKNMYMTDSTMKGYFAWSCKLDGTKNAYGPAPDGEEFFAMDLILADRKWGSSEADEAPDNYGWWARKILHTVLHHRYKMWNPWNHYIRFVPACSFTDPSYHLPHFYEHFADYAEGRDAKFWVKAAAASRNFLVKSAHPVTGMSAEYTYNDGTPNPYGPPKGHGDFFSDAYRTGANIGLDALWNGKRDELSAVADKLVTFFQDTEITAYRKYNVDGTPTVIPALHPTGLLATLAQTTLACSDAASTACEKIVRRFWETPPRTGNRRYYDNCLYLFAVLALSGKYAEE